MVDDGGDRTVDAELANSMIVKVGDVQRGLGRDDDYVYRVMEPCVRARAVDIAMLIAASQSRYRGGERAKGTVIGRIKRAGWGIRFDNRRVRQQRFHVAGRTPCAKPSAQHGTEQGEVADLVERFETRKLVDRATGLLNEKMGLSEPEAFRWIQKASMDRRLTMQDVAKAIIEQLAPKKG